LGGLFPSEGGGFPGAGQVMGIPGPGKHKAAWPIAYCAAGEGGLVSFVEHGQVEVGSAQLYFQG